ncbi:unnamed protein product [Linum tenue]|uniref:TIR domain-containing protein n=1 Tax=Linum tenue TaxID=586396 RepID=A0AAV0Q8J2_9ROSI|nr:unnamed protein product [Linum tenue]
MAASSSSSSPSSHYPYSSSYSGKWEYDVFLCFRGVDTRHGFTSHLRAALLDRQIKVFIDDMLDKTESIDELISVLKRSALSVVIFSENFADSSWCLDEVATISRRFGHRVLPVFYKVDPSDVSEDFGSYVVAIEQKHGATPPKRRKKNHGASKSQEDGKRWMDSLQVVANCAGYTSQKSKMDSEFVEAIVNGVLKILAEISQRVKSDNLIGMDARLVEVEQLLALDMNDFRIIELWGMGGVGKITLARACYQRKTLSYFLYGVAQYWKDVGKLSHTLVNLVWLDLSHCINLVAIPNLSGSSKLEFLILEGCKRLIELPSHVQDLDKLIKLYLNGCTNLRSLPPKLNSKFLKKVRLSNCPKVCHTPITEMDCYDGDGNHQLGSLPRFARLNLVGNPQLKCLSRNIWNMVSQYLLLQDCPLIESLPEISQSVAGLSELYIEGCRNLKSFPTGINNLKSLQYLCFLDTDIESLPSPIVELDQLLDLDLRSNKSLEFIPSNIHKLVKLSHLSLKGCSSIKYLPELPPNLLTLEVSGCTLLQALPCNIGKLRWKQLYFEDCPQLDMYLPQEVVLNFQNHATSNLHPQGVLQHSGSEIPRWFAYKSQNYACDSCMVVQLTLPNCTTKRLIKGIAFGIVCSSDIGYVGISITCYCNIGITAAAASWRSPSFGFGGASESDNVYIWYDKNLLGETEEGTRDEAEPWYERYAGLTVSFRFSLQASGEEYAEKPKLQYLIVLNISCEIFAAIPNLSSSSKLELLICRRCESLVELPETVQSIDVIRCPPDIKSLPSSIEELNQLSYLDLSYCESLESIPNTIHKLAKLAELLLIGFLSNNIMNLSFKLLRLDDCLQMDKSSLDEIMLNFPDQALSRHPQEVRFHNVSSTEHKGRELYELGATCGPCGTEVNCIWYRVFIGPTPGFHAYSLSMLHQN